MSHPVADTGDEPGVHAVLPLLEQRCQGRLVHRPEEPADLGPLRAPLGDDLVDPATERLEGGYGGPHRLGDFRVDPRVSQVRAERDAQAFDIRVQALQVVGAGPGQARVI